MAEPDVVIEQVEILEPKWTPEEVAMWEAGLVPVRWISREEALQKWPNK
jgi:hypothetical protein